MLPREHGAYGQLAFPLLTAFAVSGITGASLLTALAAIAVFLAHEPLLVLLGNRGVRAHHTGRHRAGLWLIATLVLATAAGIIAIDQAAASVRWTFAIPLLPGVALLVAAIRNREKTWAGETSAAVAFASVAVPMCAAAGAQPQVGAAVAVPFALLFIASTLAVRAIILRTRGGGDPVAARHTRNATLVVAGIGALMTMSAANAGAVTWGGFTAVVPGLLFATAIALFPPRATRLRTVGWTLVGLSLLTSAILIVSVRV
jgi:hypothetical protein